MVAIQISDEIQALDLVGPGCRISLWPRDLLICAASWTVSKPKAFFPVNSVDQTYTMGQAFAPEKHTDLTVAVPAGQRHNQLRLLAAWNSNWLLGELANGPGTHSADSNAALLFADGFVRQVEVRAWKMLDLFQGARSGCRSGTVLCASAWHIAPT